MVASNQNPWHRRHDDPSRPKIPRPPIRFYPNTRPDLIDIVTLALQNYDAASQAPLPEIRGNGSHWALSDAAICQGFFVETQNPEINPPNFSPPRLNWWLGNVIPSCLTPQAMSWLQTLATSAGGFDPDSVPNDVLFQLAHVEAGMRIYELYSGLDIDERAPLALQTMGAAGGQTIVGAFSTGTHGGDVLFPPLADCVAAIHMITPAFGEPLITDTPLSERIPYAAEFWIERGDSDVPPLVDEGLLQAIYPKLPEQDGPITVLRDNDLFDAVLVSAGRMGLIYSVVLRVGWQYSLEQVTTKDTWSNVKGWINNPASHNFPQRGTSANPFPADQRFVQVVVNPNAQPHNSGEHTCYVTYHNKMLLGETPLGRNEKRGARIPGTDPPEFQNAGTTVPYGQSGGLFSLPCSSSSPLKTFVGNLATASLEAAAAAAASAVFLAAEGDEVAAAAATQTSVTAGLLAAALGTVSGLIQSGPLGDAVGSICNWCAQHNKFEIVREIEELVLSNQMSLRTIVTNSYAILDAHITRTRVAT